LACLTLQYSQFSACKITGVELIQQYACVGHSLVQSLE
jgi:hypothetical protein